MSEIISIKVLFFASLKDSTGVKQAEIDLPENACVVDLREALAKQFPGASQALKACLVAINRSFAFDQDPILREAEVAFFPRVSGG